MDVKREFQELLETLGKFGFGLNEDIDHMVSIGCTLQISDNGLLRKYLESFIPSADVLACVFDLLLKDSLYPKSLISACEERKIKLNEELLYLIRTRISEDIYSPLNNFNSRYSIYEVPRVFKIEE